MPIVVTCPTCASRFAAQDHLAGNQVACPSCGGPITVPMGTSAPHANQNPGFGQPQPPATQGGIPAYAQSKHTQSLPSKPAMPELGPAAYALIGACVIVVIIIAVAFATSPRPVFASGIMILCGGSITLSFMIRLGYLFPERIHGPMWIGGISAFAGGAAIAAFGHFVLGESEIPFKENVAVEEAPEEQAPNSSATHGTHSTETWTAAESDQAWSVTPDAAPAGPGQNLPADFSIACQSSPSTETVIFSAGAATAVAMGRFDYGAVNVSIESWNLRTLSRVGSLQGNLQVYPKLRSISRDGKLLAGVKRGSNSLCIWSFEDGAQKQDIPIDYSEVSSRRMENLHFASDRIVIGGQRTRSGAYRILGWNAANGTEVYRVGIKTDSRFSRSGDWAVSISPGGRYFAVGTPNSVQFFATQSGTKQGEIPVPKGQRVRILSFSPDGREVLLGSGEGNATTFVCFDLRTGQPMDQKQITGLPGLAVTSSDEHELHWLPDKQSWLYSGPRQPIRRIERATGQVVNVSTRLKTPCRVLPNGSVLTISDRKRALVVQPLR